MLFIHLEVLFVCARVYRLFNIIAVILRRYLVGIGYYTAVWLIVVVKLFMLEAEDTVAS